MQLSFPEMIVVFRSKMSNSSGFPLVWREQKPNKTKNWGQFNLIKQDSERAFTSDKPSSLVLRFSRCLVLFCSAPVFSERFCYSPRFTLEILVYYLFLKHSSSFFISSWASYYPLVNNSLGESCPHIQFPLSPDPTAEVPLLCSLEESLHALRIVTLQMSGLCPQKNHCWT